MKSGKGSLIRGTNGYSNGIIPMLRVFNDTARYIDQGGGKKNGFICNIYRTVAFRYSRLSDPKEKS